MLRHLIAVLISLFSLTALLACGSSTSNTGTTSTTSGGSTSAPTTQHFKVGVPVNVGGTFIVTLNSAKTNTGSDISKPKAGNIYLVIDVTLKNVSTSEQNVSSALSFKLQDMTGQAYNETFADFAKAAPEGKVAPGGLNRGELVYEIPTTIHMFTIAFEANIISSGQTVWDIRV